MRNINIRWGYEMLRWGYEMLILFAEQKMRGNFTVRFTNFS